MRRVARGTFATTVLCHVPQTAAVITAPPRERERADVEGTVAQGDESTVEDPRDQVRVPAEAHGTRGNPLACLRPLGQASLKPLRRSQAAPKSGGGRREMGGVGLREGLQEGVLCNGIWDVAHHEAIPAHDVGTGVVSA